MLNLLHRKQNRFGKQAPGLKSSRLPLPSQAANIHFLAAWRVFFLFFALS
jgi:hypothetical protein